MSQREYPLLDENKYTHIDKNIILFILNYNFEGLELKMNSMFSKL